MLQFKKIIYMDSDMMAMKNLDSLFHEFPEFSAVPDMFSGIFNTGVFVLEPNVSTYRKLLLTYK